ncbi:hypothetical protein H6F87_23660 [Cyanobacteria bacterium FACHB-502]|jgi:hypothetical protein|nr:hypothetical protein [Cyanobacteria bacterium FACHB-502]
MQSIENNAFLTDLSAEEQAELNGGYRCFYVWASRRVCYWYGCFFRYVRVVRCY